MSDRGLPIATVDLDELALDLDNYRVPHRSESQSAALAYLFDAENSMDVAKEILINGYFDIELPLVAPQGNGYVVLEGNRRVSALKALHDPTIVPSHRFELENLLRRNAIEGRLIPDRLRVMIAPSKESVAHRVGRLHTGLSKKAWTLDQQATFYYAQYLGGKSISQLRAEYSGITIPRYIRIAEARRFLSNVEFADQDLTEFVKSQQLKISTLEYIYSPTRIAGLVGMRFSSDGILLGNGHCPEDIGKNLPNAERRTLEYVLSRVKSGHLNTNSPELKANSPVFERFIKSLETVHSGGVEPDLDSGTSAPLNPLGTGTDDQQPAPAPAPGYPSSKPEHGEQKERDDDGAHPQRRGSNRPSRGDKLPFEELRYGRLNDGLKEKLIELRGLYYHQFPNAAAVLMRAIFEQTLKRYLKSKKANSNGNLSNVFAEMHKLHGNERQFQSTSSAIKTGNSATPGTINWFNNIAHDAHASASPEQVLMAWRLVKGYMEFMLNELDQEAEKAQQQL